MPDASDVQYNPQGEEGKQCKDCTEFTAHSDDAMKGDCHGHDVVAGGSCNFFSAKE